MQNLKLDKLIKDNFNRIYNQAKSDAQDHFQKSILPNLNSKSLFEQISLLKKEKEKLDADINSTVYFYKDNDYNYNWLLNIYSTRALILGIDESDEFYKRIFNGILKSLVIDPYNELIKSMPTYSYADFLNGLYNPFFFELEFDTLTTEKDYYLIKKWQIANFIKIVAIEVKLIIASIQKECATMPDPLTIIKFNKDYFDNSFANTKYSSESELIVALSKFSFFKAYDFTQLNNNEALIDFDYFDNGNLPWNRIRPGLINHLQNKLVQEKPVSAFSSSPFIFYSLGKVIDWMEQVLAGHSITEHYQIPDFDKLFSKIINNANDESEALIHNFEIEHDIDNIDNEKVKCLYINIVNDLRRELKEQDVFFKIYLKKVLNLDDLKDSFIISSFLSDVPNLHSEGLKKAIILRHRMVHYSISLCSVTEDHRFPTHIEHGDVYQIMHLINESALDVDLYKRFDKLLNNWHEESMSGVPRDIASWNMLDEVKKLFKENIDRLLHYLDDCPPNNKVLYIHSRLKELKQRELGYQQMQGIYPELENTPFIKLFIDYLEIEADFIRETKDIKIIPTFILAKETKILVERNLSCSFGYKNSDKEPLFSAIKQLCLKIDFLDDQLTTPEDLLYALTSEDFTKVQNKIYINCETVQFAYIISGLSRSFHSLTPKRIEESKLFYSRQKNLIKAQNLYSNKIDAPKEKAAIDNVLKQLS